MTSLRLPDAVPRAHERAIGDVAIALGADPNIAARMEIGVPCPGCGGTDRFFVNNRKNIFLCRASGAGGDPIDLVRHVYNCGVRQAVEYLTGERMFQDRSKPMNVTSDEYRQKARERGYRIWRNGYSIDPAKGGKLVAAYFAIRRIPFPPWRMRTLREADRLPYWHWNKTRKEFAVIHEGPAMLAAITGSDGKFIGCHRTWLDLKRPDGKAEIFDPETGEQLGAKKVEGSVMGGKIVLREDLTGTYLAIGEGIETVLSWDAMHGSGQALWSGVSLGNIAGKAADTIFHPTRKSGNRRAKVANDVPADCDCLKVDGYAVTLLADGDSDPFTTRMDMARAAKRHGAVDVQWPPDGMDWNDVLREIKPARMPEVRVI